MDSLKVRIFEIPMSLIHIKWLSVGGEPLNDDAIHRITWEQWNNFECDESFKNRMSNLKMSHLWEVEIDYIPPVWVCKLELPVLDYNITSVATAKIYCYDNTEEIVRLMKTNHYGVEEWKLQMNPDYVMKEFKEPDYSKWEYTEITQGDNKRSVPIKRDKKKTTKTKKNIKQKVK